MSEPEQHTSGGAIGQRAPRHEDPRLLTGRGRYLPNITLPRTAHVAFVRSSLAHARITAIDVERARAARGVVAVLTAADLPPVALVDANNIPHLNRTPQPALAAERVRYVGELVAVVVADNRYLAEDAAELVDVDYEPLPPVLEPTVRPEGHVPLFDEFPDDVIYDQREVWGHPDDLFAHAAHVFTKDLMIHRSAPCPIEPRGVMASYDRASTQLDIWCSTQTPHLMRRRVALATSLPEHRITVHMHDVGGGFGLKIALHPEEIAVVQAAMVVNQPVKWVEDRNEHLVAAPQARGQRVHGELAVDADGKFLAMRAQFVGDVGAYSFNSSSALIEPYVASHSMVGVYKVQDYECRVVAGLTNKPPITSYRGVGMVTAQALRELLIDEAARALGLDRLEIRLENMVRGDEMPYSSALGQVYDSGAFDQSLKDLAALLGYGTFAEEQEAARQAGCYIGIGLSPHVEPGGWGTEGMKESGWYSFPSNDSARISIDPAGNVTVFVGTPSVGQGVETTMAQVAADTLGVPLEKVRVVFLDTSAAPLSMGGTRASRAAVVSGGAVGLAAEELRARLLQVAGALTETPPDVLEIADGEVRSQVTGASVMDVTEVVRNAFQNMAVRHVEPEPHLTSTRFYDPKPSYSNACIGAVVEVDVHTGHVRVLRLAGVEDCGVMINPAIVEGQFFGGVTQGLGGALLERSRYDDAGQPQASTFMDYRLPSSTEVPMIEVRHRESPSLFTWGGFKGVGESGTIGAPAAIAAAVADALSQFEARIGELPLSPEDVVELARWSE